MKKYGLEIIFVLIAISWFFAYRGHFFYWEGSDLFLTSGAYWGRYALKPGGWAEYAGNFIALFFRWKLLGGMWLALSDVVCGWLITKIMFRLGMRSLAWGVGGITMGWIVALQLNLYFTMSYTLQIVGILALFFGYLNMKRAKYRMIFFSLACPLAFLFFLPVQGGLLYLAFLISEWIIRPKEERISLWCMLGWVIFWIVLPYSWRNVILIPDWMTYTWVDRLRFTSRQQVLALGMFGIPLGILILYIFYRKSQVVGWILTGGFGVLVGWMLVVNYQGSLERRLRMLEVVQWEQWEKVKQLAGDLQEADEELLYLVTLADAKQGKLPDRLFHYPCQNVGALWMPRNLDYFSNLCGAALFYQLGILNEALARMFQAAETTPWSVDLITLRSMILLNMEMGNPALAGKYLGVLKKVPFYTQWGRARQKELQSGSRINQDYWLQDKPDFFVSGKGFSVNMENIVKAYPENQMAWDYLLCGLLIQKNIPKFYDYFVRSPYSQMQNLPVAYEEALLINAAQRREECPYPIREERKQLLNEYQEYFRLYKEKKNPEDYFPEKFRHSMWFYFHFVDNMASRKENSPMREGVYAEKD